MASRARKDSTRKSCSRPGRSRVKWASLAGENIRRSLFSNGVAVTANYGPGIIPYRAPSRCERVGIMGSRLSISVRQRAGSLAPGRWLLHSAPWQGADHHPPLTPLRLKASLTQQIRQRRHGRNGVGHGLAAAGNRVGRQPHHNQTHRRVDMNHLTMDTHCFKRAVRVVADPPLVAVGIARLIIPPRRLERLAVRPLTDSADHLGTDYLMTIELAFQTHHLGKAGQITQGDVETGACPFRTLGVQQHVAILLGTQLAPDPLFDQRCGRQPRYPAQNPAKHLGMSGAVAESDTVL